MAAYAALVSLMNDLELIPNHPTHSFSFDSKKISSLSVTVHFLIDFMESYDSHGHGCSRESTEALESRIARAARAAHEVIESHIVDQIHVGSTLLDGEEASYDFLDFFKTRAKKFGSTLLRKARFYFLPDLQKAIDDMELVEREVMQFKEQNDLKAEQPKYSAPTSSEPLTSEKIHMVGFDADLVRLLEMLTGEPSGRRRLIPIVGMGGIGKTTLAKYAFQHLLIQHHFDVRLWATVSQDYSVKKILKQLLFRETRSPSGGNFIQLEQQLHKMLWGKRYLVVLDDMWSVEAWNDIRTSLPDNASGSCVIVTTRLSNLSPHLSSFSPFEMNFLDKDRSWELFCGKVFGEEDCPVELEGTGKEIVKRGRGPSLSKDCPVELEEIGREIVKRCRGLPLSIVVVGGHLRKSSRAIEYWERVANYMNPISSLGKDEQCLEIISLSYEHLPIYLKPCFLYMGIYPEDGWIDASQLVKFWIAEGFIKPNKGMSLEEVAEDYLKNLIDMNLIFVRERRWDGKAEYCVIHDIVRELCLKVAEKEKFLYVLQDTTQAIRKERRVVVPNELSLLGAQHYYIAGTNFQQLNLRYVALSCERRIKMRNSAEIFRIPSSIYLLWNMQTLIIHNHDVEISAPFKIWKMTQLRHLEFIRARLRHPVPNHRSKQLLINLHTLIGVEDLRLTDEVCKRMPNLKKLSLKYTHFPDDCKPSSFYCPQNFCHFNQLESLHCSFSDDSNWRDVVERLIFPSSLEELSLQNSQLDWGELTTMIKPLSLLGSLALDSVQGPDWDLAEEKFPHLKVLRISRCDDLISWNADRSHFPVLEILHISEVPNLNEIPSDIGKIPTLERIELIGSSASLAISASRIVAEQESLGNEDLSLDVGFWGMQELERFQNMIRDKYLRDTCTSLGLY